MLCNGSGREGNNPRCVKIRAIKPRKPTQYSTSVRGWGKESILKEDLIKRKRKQYTKNLLSNKFMHPCLYLYLYLYSVVPTGREEWYYLWGGLFGFFGGWYCFVHLFFWCGTFSLFCSNFILFFLFHSNFIPRTMTNLIFQLAFGFYLEFLKLNTHRHGNISFFEYIFLYAVRN